MTRQRVIAMIDEYLLEPHSINAEWVEALTLCKRVLESNDTTKHSKWEISVDGYYPYCLECGHEPNTGNLTDFCPKCGCRMDGDINA